MPYTAKIISAAKYTSQADNQVYLDVEFNILDKRKIIQTRKLGFPLATDAKKIESEIKKYIKTYEHDQDLARKSLEVEESQKQADKVIKTLIGKEV